MTWAQLLSGIVSLFNKVMAFIHDKQIADNAVAKAKLEGIEAENDKVNSAIVAGNDVTRVQLESDPQDRANKRKAKSL